MVSGASLHSQIDNSSRKNLSRIRIPDPGGCGDSIDITLASKSRVPWQQSRDRIRQPSQSPERGQENRLCIKTNLELGGVPTGVKKRSRIHNTAKNVAVLVK
jgi:hypothetical protein